MIELLHMDCMEYTKSMPDNSVDAIVTDPPYFGVKDAEWDNQWKDDKEFIAWIGSLCDEWKRILKPNGSLYCFASPQMAWHVEGEIRKRFNVLSAIRWVKAEGWHKKAEKEALRSFLSPWEVIVFAEQFAANEAITMADYELNGHVFAELKEWFRQCARSAGIVNGEFNRALGFAHNGGGVASGVIGDKIQFSMPTPEVYAKMQAAYPVFDRPYEELRLRYEELRRPFQVTPDVPTTDTWTFNTVAPYEGKHECEKPLALMEHIILASTRAGDVVFDPFTGSGTTGVACVLNGRKFIGTERDAHWHKYATRRIEKAARQPRLFDEPKGQAPQQLLIDPAA